MSLTDLSIKKLKAPNAGQKTYYDPSLKGFGVRVSQGGTKTFVVVYGPRRKRKTIGRYPEWSLSDARAQAKRIQADATQGGATSQIPIPPLTFDEARNKFLQASKQRNRPGTYYDYKRLLNKHFAWNKKLADIERVSIVRAVDCLHKTPAEQKAAFVALRTMMNWCVRRGYLYTSPMPMMSFKTRSRDRIHSDDELKAIWHYAANLENSFGKIIQLLILTGQRRGEIAGLRRTWIRDDNIVFPGSAVKNGRQHVLPLTTMTHEILDATPSDGDLFFPARGLPETVYDGFNKAKPKMDSALGLEPHTLHDIRRTFSSNQARLGTPIHVTEKLLNHVSGTLSGIAAVYNRYSYADEMRKALEAHDTFLAKLISD